MSIEQVIQFMEKTATDEALQQQLQSVMGTEDGDISSVEQLDTAEATVLKGESGIAVVNLAAQNGFEFSTDELIQVITAFEKHQSGELSEAEFTKFITSSDLHEDIKEHLFSAEQTIELVFLDRRYTKKVATNPNITTKISSVKAGDRLTTSEAIS